MKKKPLTSLVTLVVFTLVITAVKHHPVSTPVKTGTCKAACPKQKATEDKKSNSGLIFWDTYAGQLLNIQVVSSLLP
jgi:hypothetical protein